MTNPCLMHRTLNRSLQDVLMSERIPRTDRNSSCQVLIVHSLLLVICRSRSTGITAERALSLEMERTIERQPLREITTPVNQKPDAPRTPSDDIVQRLMSRIRELEHRLFDPEGAWGGMLGGNHVTQVILDYCRRCVPEVTRSIVFQPQSTNYISRWACIRTARI